MSKNTAVIVGIVIVLFLAGAYFYATRSATPPKDQQSTGIANPASTNCVNLGGTLEIKNDTASGGEVGYCHLKDGRVCEEWSLFRGGCTAPSTS